MRVPLGNPGVLAVAFEGQAAASERARPSRVLPAWSKAADGRVGVGHEEKRQGRESWKTSALVCDMGD